LAYIGNIPAESYASFETETFSVSATANYTLSHAVTNENEIRLVINGVVQQPGSGKAYTASGTTLTLTSATVSGDSMYAVYLGRALQTVNPPNASVGLSQLSATGTKSSSTFLRGDNTFATAGGDNTPAFLAIRSSNQGNVADNTWTKIQFNTEKFDTDNTYDNSSNYRFTPAVAGKYKLFAQVGGYGQSGGVANNIAIRIYKNGTDEVETRRTFDSAVVAEGGTTAITTEAILDSDTDDYFEVYWYINTNGGVNATVDYNATKLYTYFGAYKLIT